MKCETRCGSQRTHTCRDVRAPIVELGVTSPLVSVDLITPLFRFGPGHQNTSKKLTPAKLHCTTNVLTASGIDVAGTVIPFRNTVKLLGVTLDSVLTS